MTFVASTTRVEILRRLGTHVGAAGRLAVGFSGGCGYEFDAFLADATTAANLIPELLSNRWALRPFTSPTWASW